MLWLPGDADHQQRWLQVLQDQSAHCEDPSDWRQVCQSPRTEGNMWNHVQTRGEEVIAKGGRVAQLIENWTCEPWVIDSN